MKLKKKKDEKPTRHDDVIEYLPQSFLDIRNYIVLFKFGTYFQYVIN